MTKLVAITTLVSGILLILVPRYILPACEYEGFSRMHCSDTAQAEYLVGALLMVIGGLTIFFKTVKPLIASAITTLILSVVAFRLPDKLGYCGSTRMPCNYGMVPGIRFIAVITAIIMLIGLIGLLKTYRKKGNA